MKKRFSTMQRSGVLKRIFACVIALALVMPMTVQTGWAATTSYTVSVADGYLALRNAKAYDVKNEIGKLYSRSDRFKWKYILVCVCFETEEIRLREPQISGKFIK